MVRKLLVVAIINEMTSSICSSTSGVVIFASKTAVFVSKIGAKIAKNGGHYQFLGSQKSP